MMRRLSDVAFACFACVALGVTDAGARTPTEDRRALIAIEQRWLAHQSDASVLETILADDFTHPVGAGVFLTKQQHIAWARAHPAPAGVHWRFETLSVRLFGDAAVANGVVRRTGPRGERQSSIFTDVFVFRHGRWQAVNAQENVVSP